MFFEIKNLHLKGAKNTVVFYLSEPNPICAAPPIAATPPKTVAAVSKYPATLAFLFLKQLLVIVHAPRPSRPTTVAIVPVFFA